MADEKLTDLTGETAPAENDLLYIVDVSDTTDDAAGTSMNITLETLFQQFAKPCRFAVSGSQNLTTTEATMVFDTEDFDPTGNYANSSGEITCTIGGYMHFDYCMPINADSTSGATRCGTRAWLQRDQGTGTWIDAALFSQDYHRESSGGSGQSFSGIQEIADGEAIRVRVDNTASTDTSTESGEVTLSIHRVG